MNLKIESVLNGLEDKGWAIQENFFPIDIIQQLKETLSSLRQQGILKQAGIGREKNHQVEQSIRSDKISWFDENNLETSQVEFLKTTTKLQDAINERFYLGLFELEVHFASYAPNTFYKRHLDQHKNQDTRVVTIIVYLNEDWNKDDGGELQIYMKDGSTITIQPNAGTLVCFMSAEFEHEVLPAKRERESLTGWFRKREY